MTIVTDTHPQVSSQSETILQHRYYLKDEDHNLIEDSHGLFQRVAEAIARVDSEWYAALPVEVDLLANEFYNMMAMFEFLPNSPTLMNAGTNQGTLSACFVLPLEDSMEGIMQAATHSAMVQKFGGGTGFALSKLRPKGTSIKSTHGIACGPIEVLKTLSRVSSMITQGGKRDGANMAVMSVYHPDILEFISCKSTEGDIHNFNISVGVDSNWMKLVDAGLDYPLINPQDNTIAKHLNAREVFNKIVMGAWENGEPGMVFLDRINEDNHMKKEYGSMISTNPCGEQPLLGNESCNLGSINLAKFVLGSKDIQLVENPWKVQIDWSLLEDVTRTATRFLDNVIDINEYATSDIENMTKATRKIGLGVMGFADLLIQLRISYNSTLAREVGTEIMEKIKGWVDHESLNLAVQRGTFPAWEKSSYNKETEAYRNSCRLTVAPTGTISMLADCSSGIEPTFALVWKKQNILEGKTLNYANKYFEEDAKEYGFYSDNLMDYLANGGSLQDRGEVPRWAKNIYITASEISPEDHVLMQAAFQQHVDSGISKTINFDNSVTVQDVEKAYKLAWITGCKGITVYREGSREKEVLVKGIENANVCCDSPNIVMQDGCQSCKTCGWSACLVA